MDWRRPKRFYQLLSIEFDVNPSRNYEFIPVWRIVYLVILVTLENIIQEKRILTMLRSLNPTMITSNMFVNHKLVADAGEVLTLFLIPVGGGIPAGVLLAKARGIGWQFTTLLYFVSDLVLACVFEPCMILFLRYANKSNRLRRWAEEYKRAIAKTGFKYGLAPSPLALIILSFGVDPMTGRSAARAAGHGFLGGWALAISGDMIFFALIMISTLFLNHLFGDGTTATVLVMAAMMIIPMAIDRFKKVKKAD
jgi:hypothetical protein